MKHLICVVACLFLFVSGTFAAKFESTILKTDSATGQFYYEKVVETNNTSKEALYKAVKTWVVAHIKTVDNNIAFDDAGFGTIVTTPTISISDVGNVVKHQAANFKLTIFFKDNKFKISATDFTYYGIDMQNAEYTGPLEKVAIKRILPNPTKKVAEHFDDAFSAFINQLSKASAPDQAKNDW